MDFAPAKGWEYKPGPKDVDIQTWGEDSKNILNKFRQDHGYKDRSYIKIWNGVEDNAVMNEILQNGASSVDEIYAKLKTAYQNIQ